MEKKKKKKQKKQRRTQEAFELKAKSEFENRNSSTKSEINSRICFFQWKTAYSVI